VAAEVGEEEPVSGERGALPAPHAAIEREPVEKDDGGARTWLFLDGEFAIPDRDAMDDCALGC
jgi:hypothetical protein